MNSYLKTQFKRYVKLIRFTSRLEATGKPETLRIAETRTPPYIRQTSAETASTISSTLKTRGLHHILLRIIKIWRESWTGIFILKRTEKQKIDFLTVKI